MDMVLVYPSQPGRAHYEWVQKSRSKAILASQRHTQVGTATIWEQVSKPGTGLSFANASTAVPALLAQFAPQLWSAFIQCFFGNISSSVQTQQTNKCWPNSSNPSGMLDRLGRLLIFHPPFFALPEFCYCFLPVQGNRCFKEQRKKHALKYSPLLKDSSTQAEFSMNVSLKNFNKKKTLLFLR